MSKQVRTSPLDHDVGSGHLCVKGRFGFEFVQRRARAICSAAFPVVEIGKNRSGSMDAQAPAPRHRTAAYPVMAILSMLTGAPFRPWLAGPGRPARRSRGKTCDQLRRTTYPSGAFWLLG